jgi:hypothetical protein
VLQNNRATTRRMPAKERLWRSSARRESWFTWYVPTMDASPSRYVTTTATRTGVLIACPQSHFEFFTTGTVRGPQELNCIWKLVAYWFAVVIRVFYSHLQRALIDSWSIYNISPDTQMLPNNWAWLRIKFLLFSNDFVFTNPYSEVFRRFLWRYGPTWPFPSFLCSVCNVKQ